MPIVAPATLPDNALIVPWEPAWEAGGSAPRLAAEALDALGRARRSSCRCLDKQRINAMSEKMKVKPQPEASYGTMGDDGFGIALMVIFLAVAVGLVLVIFTLSTAERREPDVWAQIDRDVSACIERGIDEVSCQRIALEMAGIDLAGISMEVDVAE